MKLSDLFFSSLIAVTLITLLSNSLYADDSFTTKTFKAEFNDSIVKVVSAPLTIRNNEIIIDPVSTDCAHTNNMIKVSEENEEGELQSWCESRASIKKSYGVNIYE